MTALRALPTTGRYIIDTVTDQYEVDVDFGQCIYLDMASEASGKTSEPVTTETSNVVAVVGYPIYVDDVAGEVVIGITRAQVNA